MDFLPRECVLVSAPRGDLCFVFGVPLVVALRYFVSLCRALMLGLLLVRPCVL